MKLWQLILLIAAVALAGLAAFTLIPSRGESIGSAPGAPLQIVATKEGPMPFWVYTFTDGVGVKRRRCYVVVSSGSRAISCLEDPQP